MPRPQSAITRGSPPDGVRAARTPEARDEEQRARWILSHLLEWHRREDKVTWWEYFRLADILEEDMVDERAALGGLTFDRRIGWTAKCRIDRYRYPLQDTQIEVGDGLRATGGDAIGSVADIDYGARTVDIKKRSAVSDVHPAGVFAFERVDIKVLAGAIERLAVDVIEHGMARAADSPRRGGSCYERPRPCQRVSSRSLQPRTPTRWRDGG